MRTSITLAEITQRLEANLQALTGAAIGQYLSYPEYCKRQPRYAAETNDNLGEMDNYLWGIDGIASSLEINDSSSTVAALEIKIANGMNGSIQSLRLWQTGRLPNREMGIFDRTAYKLSVRFRTKIDEERQAQLRRILSYEPCLDAQIILQHTDEFEEAFGRLTPTTRARLRDSLVSGYHAQGLIVAGIMRGLKQQCGITVDYDRMSEAVAH